MRILTLSAALIATTLSSAAVAADWVLVTASTDGTLGYVDRESIRTMPNGYKRAWMRIVYAEPIDYGITSAEVFKEFDCRERRSRYLQSIFLKGKEVTTTVNRPSDWDYHRPDSAAEGLLEYVCFGRLP